MAQVLTFSQSDVQLVRIVDILILGPAMVLGGRRLGGILGAFLLVSGFATILFNGIRFLENAND